MKKYKNKIIFQKASKRAIIHSEGVQIERLDGIVQSIRSLLSAANTDFELDVADPNTIKELLIETFGEDITIMFLNDDIAAPWAVGFAQASIIAHKLLNEDFDDE